MEESFANTMDFFVSYGARDICHTIFVSQSTFYYGDTVQVLTPLKCEIGLRATFKLIWLAFMHANFLFKELREDKLERCLQFVLDGDRGAISRRQHAKLRRLANAACRKAFELNIRFRLRTSRLYFKTQGISTPLLRLLDFDFMSRLEQQAALRDWLDLTCKVATQGVVPDMLRGGVRRAV